MINQYHFILHQRARQTGAVLAMALIFLLLLTIIGISAISTSTLQEKMSGNMQDRNRAFQAAEATLRDAERHIDTTVNAATVFTTACTNGLCTPALATASTLNDDVWKSSSGVVDWSSGSTTSIRFGAITGTTQLPSLSEQPRYIIEKLSASLNDGTGGGVDTAGLVTDHGSSRQFITSPGVFYRITARGRGRTGAVVMLQSIYRK